MKQRIFLTTLLLATILVSCTKEAPIERLGLQDNYAITRYQTLRLEAKVKGTEYKWAEVARDGVNYTDTIFLSTESVCDFIYDTPGIYTIFFQVKGDNPLTHVLRIHVEKELSAYNALAVKVLDYSPAPAYNLGRFPQAANVYGDANDVVKRKLTSICANALSDEVVTERFAVVSLGSFGGSITLGFDHMVSDVEGAADLEIGRPTDALQHANKTGLTPLAVEVAYDPDGKGPDAVQWYQLLRKGNEDAKRVKVTYTPTGTLTAKAFNVINLAQGQMVASWTIDATRGVIPNLRTDVSDNMRFPQWLGETTYETYRYTNLAGMVGYSITTDGANPPTINTGTYTVTATSHNDINGAPAALNQYDIAWAVDANGQRVELPGIHYVRVSNPVMLETPEISNQGVPEEGSVVATIAYVKDLGFVK